MSRDPLHTRLCERLGVEYPIVAFTHCKDVAVSVINSGGPVAEYYDEGDPAWRWYLMKELTRKPTDFPFETVWCESESIFLLDE